MTLPQTNARDTGFDMLKLFLALDVVIHHAGQAYGPTGGRWPIMHAEKFAPLGMFFHTNASFFMGLFFLISAYFLPPSFEKKGAKRFLIERFRKFGAAILIFGLAIAPIPAMVQDHKAWSEAVLPFDFAHLWFLSHLLVYGALYALYRLWRPAAPEGSDLAFPALPWLLGYIVVLAETDLILRHWWPIDLWGRFILVAEVAHLPQYISLFLFGLAAWRYRWLHRIPARTGWAMTGLFAAAIAFRISHFIFRYPLMRSDGVLPDLLWDLWEATICTSACVSLIFLFHRYAGTVSPWMRACSRHSFAIYVLHLPVLVGFQFAFERTAFGPLSLTLITAIATILSCFALSVLWGRLTGAMRSPQLAVSA